MSVRYFVRYCLTSFILLSTAGMMLQNDETVMPGFVLLLVSGGCLVIDGMRIQVRIDTDELDDKIAAKERELLERASSNDGTGTVSTEGE